MTSAGKWVLGLLLLVVGAVFVARTISADPDSQAQVKQLSPAAVAGASKGAEAQKAAAAAAAKKAAAPAGDLACKKACVEVNEVSNDSITTAKLAPGSVTLSKLAFEVPNLNELENEINARKSAEASSKAALAGTEAALAETAAAQAQNDASITAAAANGLSVESAARAAAIDDLGKKTAAADADVLTKLNKEIVDRGAADDVLQGKLNTEIADRAGALLNLRSELGNPNSVGAPIVKINNNEIVGDAITTDKVIANTLLADDLATGAVTSDEILNDTVAAVDLAESSVVGRAAGETLTNTKARSLRGERETNSATSTQSAGDLALGTITGEGDNVISRLIAIGNIGLRTIGRGNLVDGSVDTAQLEASSVTSDKILLDTILAIDIAPGAVTTSEIFDGTVKSTDIGAQEVTTGNIADQNVTNGKLADVDPGGVNGAVSTAKINAGAVTAAKLADVNASELDGAVSSSKISKGAVTATKLADVGGSGTGGAVTTTKIDSGAVTFEKLAADAVRGGRDGGPANNIVDGSITDDDLNPSAGVSGGKLRDGSVTSSKLSVDAPATPEDEAAVATVNIQARAVTAAGLAPDAVDSTKIADGTVTSADLALAAATVNATPVTGVSGLPLPKTFTLTGVPGTSTQNIASTTLAVTSPTSPVHKVQLIGQAQLTCTTCDATDLITVTWRLKEGVDPALSRRGGEYKTTVTGTNSFENLPVSVLLPDVPAGSHVYDFEVKVDVTGPASTTRVTTVIVDNITLAAVDLGA